MFLGRFH